MAYRVASAARRSDPTALTTTNLSLTAQGSPPGRGSTTDKPDGSCATPGASRTCGARTGWRSSPSRGVAQRLSHRGKHVAFPPKRDIRGLRTPAEGMSVARMVVIRCFCVSAFLRFCVSAFRRFGVSFLRSEGQLLIQYGDHLSACTGEPCTCGFTDALASWSEHAN